MTQRLPFTYCRTRNRTPQLIFGRSSPSSLLGRRSSHAVRRAGGSAFLAPDEATKGRRSRRGYSFQGRRFSDDQAGLSRVECTSEPCAQSTITPPRGGRNQSTSRGIEGGRGVAQERRLDHDRASDREIRTGDVRVLGACRGIEGAPAAGRLRDPGALGVRRPDRPREPRLLRPDPPCRSRAHRGDDREVDLGGQTNRLGRQPLRGTAQPAYRSRPRLLDRPKLARARRADRCGLDPVLRRDLRELFHRLAKAVARRSSSPRHCGSRPPPACVHGPRAIALVLVVPVVLVTLIKYVFYGSPVSTGSAPPLLGVFPMITMFLVTSVTNASPADDSGRSSG